MSHREALPSGGASVRSLRVALTSSPDVAIVDGIDLDIPESSVLALVGESGSGKSTVGLALLGYAREGAYIAGGRIVVGDVEITSLSARQLQEARARVVSYIPQNPATALNPAMRIGAQLDEVFLVHGVKKDGRKVGGLLEQVDLPTDRAFTRRFPHELSGGQQQRVAIAMAISLGPKLIVLDEPTTALDVLTQARIVELIGRLAGETAASFLYVTHDLAVVSNLATRVAVMYGGRVVESGSAQQVFSDPRHPYTAGLINAIPRLEAGSVVAGIPGSGPGIHSRPDGCSFAPRCSLVVSKCTQREPTLLEVGVEHLAACVRPHDVVEARLTERPIAQEVVTTLDDTVLNVSHLAAQYRGHTALADVSFELHRGECLAIVGRSGSGKTTLARCVAGLHEPSSGSISLKGESLAPHARSRSQLQRRSLQYVFQNPDQSLNPRYTVGTILRQAIDDLLGIRGEEAQVLAADLIDRVRLPASALSSFPRDMSGGERQRVSIARALVASPEVLICDEVTSALDVSVQASVVQLLKTLSRELGMAMLFITHDLGLVASVADTVLVLDGGRTREFAATVDLLQAPRDSYTRALLEASPTLDRRRSSRASSEGSSPL